METKLNQVFVGVGANLLDRWATIQGAIALLRANPSIQNVEASPIYETAPIGGIKQPPFLNLVLGLETNLTPEALLETLHVIERKFGRDRSTEVRWGPRTLDLDMLVFEGETRSGGELWLPHPRMWERAFVVTPLAALLRRSQRYNAARWPELPEKLGELVSDPDVRLWNQPQAV